MNYSSIYHKQKSWTSLLLLLLLLGSSGCTIIKTAIDEIGDVLTNLGNDTNEILDQAVSDLNANAGNFGRIMEEAIEQVNEANIKAQLQDALDNAIITASTEIRCNIQFTGDYLVKRIKAIKAGLNNTTPPIEAPRVCNTTPSVIDMNRPANQRNSIAITGYFLNEDTRKYRLYHYSKNGRRSTHTRHLTVSTDFKLIINLGSNGITLTDQSDKLVLMWDGDIVSEIPVIQRQPEPCQIRERRLEGLPSMVLYPVHKRSPWVTSRGDTEFKGNGPCTRGNVAIFTRNNGRELWARAFVQMWECPDNLGKIKKDYTYGDVTREIKLAEADAGWQIINIREGLNDAFQNIDRNADRTENIGGSGPVLNYKIQGDTSGDDLGSSRVEVSFRPIRVTFQEVGDCLR